MKLDGEEIKLLTCPICLGTGIENTLHAGSIPCYYCHGKGHIGYYRKGNKKDEKAR